VQSGNSNDPLRILWVTAAAYVLVFFLLAPGNSLISYPVHHDDYNNLSIRWPPHIHTVPLSSFPPRPVSYYLLALLSSLGIPVYYLALHAFTLGYAWGVLCIAVRLLQPWTFGLPVLFSAAAAAFGIENAIEYSKYTGLITSLSSGFFAVLAILVMIHFHDRAFPFLTLVSTLLLAAMSLFAKEDFPLPILLSAAWIAWANRRSPTALRWYVLFGSLLLVAAAAVAYNKIAASPFTAGTEGTYKPDFSAASILRTSWLYLMQTPAASAITALQGLSLAALAFAPAGLFKSRGIVLQAMALGPLLPYACLPHHLTFYYPFLWAAWQAPIAVLLLSQIAPPRIRVPAAGIAAATVLAISQPGRAQTARFYRAESERNVRMVKLLRSYRDPLLSYSSVAVEGAPILGPWFGSDGAFLANRYGLNHTWIVRAPRDSDYYRGIIGLLNSTVQGRVQTVPTEVPRDARLPVVRLNPDGSGAVVFPFR
jgi:hypothetical protein